MTIKKASIAENLIFKLRGPILVLFLLLTAFFAYEATNVKLSTDLKKMVPLKHEFIQNLFKHKDELSLAMTYALQWKIPRAISLMPNSWKCCVR